MNSLYYQVGQGVVNTVIGLIALFILYHICTKIFWPIWTRIFGDRSEDILYKIFIGSIAIISVITLAAMLISGRGRLAAIITIIFFIIGYLDSRKK